MTLITLKNSREAIRQRVDAGLIRPFWPLGMVLVRTLLFAAWQAVIAGIYALLGQSAPWDASAAWWPGTAFLGSVVTLVLLQRLARREGLRLTDLYNIDLKFGPLEKGLEKRTPIQ